MALDTDLVTNLQEVFDVCDEENLGYLSLRKLTELGYKYFGGSEEDMVQLIQCLDPRGQGFVSFPDFCKGVTSVLRHQNGYNELADVGDNSWYDKNTYSLKPNSVQATLVPATNDCVMSQDELTPTSTSTLVTDTKSTVASSNDITGRLLGFEDKRSSPTFSFSDGEERYECYGEGDDPENEINESGIYLEVNGSYKPSLSSDSFRSTSSAGSTGSGGRTRSHHSSNFQHNTWLRSSLRRASGSSKRLSSNALASQLFRSGTPNSHAQPSNSRRSSISCDSTEDMYTDMSLEDDVMDLNQKVQMLQHQVTVLTENQTTNDDRYSKVKQENAALLNRIHSLEELIRELEIRSEERIKEEERHLKESLNKQERDKAMEIELYSNRLYCLQQEHFEIKEEVFKFKQQVEKLKHEKTNLQEQLADTSSELCSLQEEQHKLQELSRREREEFANERKANAQLLKDLNQELDDLRRYHQETENIRRSCSPSMLDLPARYQELECQVHNLREENRCLREANEELQAQLLNNGVLEGRSLLNQKTTSLAEEFENLSKDQVMEALKEQQEVNAKLRNYIDGILLNIVENYPQLLEVKSSRTGK
ncbi:rab11 family-interacting protein 4A-like isoform X2 [Tachypleus tridentatus]|uniref:rab11 family-interacting protein 4A-like isoform X2 n=1 Tax=Tachypleus tridentatus TaxID=6853 RepID=UPI003FD49D36